MIEKIDIRVRNDLMYSYIPVWSVAENEYLNAYMLIDTGASVTSFGDLSLKRLGCYSEEKKTSVKTAGCNVDVFEVRIPKIKIASFELFNVKAHSHAFLSEFYFDGIIGMNVLKLFNFSVNFDKQEMSLEKRIFNKEK